MERYKPSQENNKKKRGLGLGEAAALGLAALTAGPVSEEVQAQYSTEIVPLSKTPAQLTEEELQEMREVGDLLSQSSKEEVEKEEATSASNDEYTSLTEATRAELAAAEATVALQGIDFEERVRLEELIAKRPQDTAHVRLKHDEMMQEYEAGQNKRASTDSVQENISDAELEPNRIKAALDAAKS